MQYLLINKEDTLQDISRIVGRNNADLVLNENSLIRMPKIGKQYYQKCADYLATNPEEVTASRKTALLNNMTDDEEIFEKACLMDEEGWKILSAFQSFPDAIKVPESLTLPYSTKVIGKSLGDGVETSLGSTMYRRVMNELKDKGTINPEIFNTINTSLPVKVNPVTDSTTQVPQFSYNLPWGKIQLYSSLLDETVDIPAYPESGVDTERSASYTSMPDIIYQYEPWIVYQSSGPREQTIDFHLHRDMWTGNHLDGNANKLIRFCEANTFAKYNGSAVVSPIVRLYISGKVFISGVLTRTSVKWSGPIGLDDWYLDFNLSLTIHEVSESVLNIDTVSKFGIIGT